MLNYMTETNKFKGYCAGCAIAVPAGEGFYNGNVWCEEPTQRGGGSSVSACTRYHEREEKQKAEGEIRRAAFYASAEYVAQKEESDRKGRERATAELALHRQGLQTCNRCGGAGSAEQWAATGRTCYKCEGRGTVPATKKQISSCK